MGRRITDDDERQILAAYKDNRTYEKTAEATGWSVYTIWRVLIRNGAGKGMGNHEKEHHGGTPQKITDDQLRDAVKTMSRQQIAEHYGMHIASLDRRMRRIGVHAVRAVANPSVKAREWHFSETTAKLVQEQTSGEFSLVAVRGDVFKLKCSCCGTVEERRRSTVRRYKTTCKACEEKRRADKETADARAMVTKALAAVYESKRPKTCASCGGVFFSQYQTAKYCSQECRKKSKKRGKYSSRARKYGAKYESGVTLIRVYERDGGICKICGKPTDWNDTGWNGSFGAMYPTIDHIKALANGGAHAWGNVQLAHAICNSHKRDTV